MAGRRRTGLLARRGAVDFLVSLVDRSAAATRLGPGDVEYQVLAVLSEAPQRSMGKPSRSSRVSSSQYGGHSVATTATGVSDGWRSRSRSAAAIRSPEGCKRY